MRVKADNLMHFCYAGLFRGDAVSSGPALYFNGKR